MEQFDLTIKIHLMVGQHDTNETYAYVDIEELGLQLYEENPFGDLDKWISDNKDILKKENK